MDNYKVASKKRLRFSAPKGLISVEDLWNLSMETLDAMAREIHTRLSQSSISFLPGNNTSSGNEDDILRLDILKDIIATKFEAAQAQQKNAELARKKQQLNDILFQVQQRDLMSKSPKEIEDMIAALDS